MATWIRLDRKLKRLKFSRFSDGTHKAFYLRELICRGMDVLEAIIWRDVLEGIRKGEEGVLSSAEVSKELDL